MSDETKFPVTCVSISGGSPIEFQFDGDTFRASLAGASLYGEYRGGGACDLRVTAANGEILADLVVNPRSHCNTIENVTDIGSALLWSHERWVKAEEREALPCSDGVGEA